MFYRFFLKFLFLSHLFLIIFKTTALLAQENTLQNCVVVEKISNDLNLKSKTVSIQNNTNTVIKCNFEFDLNGFFDESSLKKLIQKGIDTTKSKASNQLIILNNIAKIIKSPSHRNFHLLFNTNSVFVNKKKYSPLAMITSFYDKQCADYQRLAAQLAILTPYFNKTDFRAYYINQHNVIDVKIGDDWIFHDFDPGQPGFRFYADAKKEKLASFNEILNNPLLIQKEQFYTYNSKSLCPWITESYYRSLFYKLNGQTTYTDIDKVFGFVPKWVIPPQTEMSFALPDTTLAAKFGTEVMLNKNDILIKKVFKSYTKYRKNNRQKHLLEMNKNISKYLKKNYNFNFEFNLLYLIDVGLVYKGDSTIIKTKPFENFITVTVSTGQDSILFPIHYHIPLPLHKVLVQQGAVTIIESQLKNNKWEDLKYIITDSLLINLYNHSSPVATSEKERNTSKLDTTALIFGPSSGYISPNSTVTFQYYYNPFYYTFQDLIFKIHYLENCNQKLKINLK